jgi:hypothetical protein
MVVRVSVAMSIVLACNSSPNGPDGGGRPVDAMDGNACSAPGRDRPEVDFFFVWDDSYGAHSAELGGVAQRTITASSDTLNIYVLAIANITLSAGVLHDGTYICGVSDGGRDSANVTFNNGANTPYEDCTITLSFTADGDGCPRVSGTFSAGKGVDGGAALNGRFDVPLR